MKLIMENWRRFLTEGIDPRIQKILDMMESPGGTKVAQYIRRTEKGKAITFEYRRVTDDERGVGNLVIEREPSHEGECSGGWHIASSVAEKGWGPLLYEVALEWASANAGGLTSDRRQVSDQAASVWDKYLQRFPDAAQLDIDNTRDSWKGVKQLTPDDPSDDCEQDSAWRDMSDKLGGEFTDDSWQESPLSKLYKKDNTEVIDYLKSKELWKE